MENKRYPQLITQFFNNSQIKKELGKEEFYIFRSDGILVYNQSKTSDASVAALMAGSWQAAMALSGQSMLDHLKDDFRFSFDTSSNGVYILPINLKSEKLYMGLLYKNVENPGYLKNKFRMIVEKLCDYLEYQTKKTTPVMTEKDRKRDGYLFNEISDDDMNKLFGFLSR